MRRVLLSLIVLVLGCGLPPPEWDNLEPGALGTSSAGVGVEPPELRLELDGDWTTALSSTLVAGSTLRVRYDESRLPQCRGDFQGRPGWSITGFWRLNGGPVGSFEAGGYSPSQGTAEPLLPLTAEGELELWFQVTNRWGCSAYDSNFGNNWRFSVGEQPAVHFTRDWKTLVKATPRAGATLRVDFDLERLPHCRQTYNGAATWEVLAHFRVDGGEVVKTPVTQRDGMSRFAAPAYFVVPAGARKVELWFQNSDRAGCVNWDSRYGANYTFFVE